MAPYDKLVIDLEKDDAAKEIARLSRIQILWEKFDKASREKGRDKQDGVNNNDDEMDDDVDACTVRSDEHDKDFSYHSSDGSAEEDGNQHDIFQHADGTSPMATKSEHNTDHQDALPNWHIEANHTPPFDKRELISAPINQIFPCIACLNNKNINDPLTWAPVFLRKSSNTSWEVFDDDFNDLGYGLEWDGDEGLENLWGLYF
jgi:hypothetical protein